jgi:lysophospholipase L1-like esterase
MGARRRARFRPRRQALDVAAALAAIISTAAAAIPPQPILSRGVPAYASAGTASHGNNAHYGHGGDWCADCAWDARVPAAWLAYDLSGVPANRRSRILAVWYNGSGRYDYTIVKAPTYSMPGPYVLEGNTAPGGGHGAPAAGWVTLVSGDSPQIYHSRQHVMDFAGYNWLRFRTLAENPFNAGGNPGTAIKFDVYDASQGISDDWIIFGDSITEGAFSHNDVGALIHARLPQYNPIWEGGGVGFQKASDGASRLLDKWLPLFPGKYVCLAYGTNDANLGRALDQREIAAFRDNYRTMVEKVLALRKTPVVPTVIWSRNPQVASNLALLNAQLAALKTARPQILSGPDLYDKFQGHPEWYQDDLHPNPAGQDVLRSTWAQWAIGTVYAGAAAAQPAAAQRIPDRPGGK